MDTKSLMQLYQKLIQGESEKCNLINTRKLNELKKNYTPSQLAKFRFSDEYLQLLNNQKAFNQTIVALKHFFTGENSDIKQKKILDSPNFYHFLFQHLFSQSEKILLEQIVQAEFSGKKSQSSNAQYFKANDKKQIQKGMKVQVQVGKEENELKTNQKHVFFQLLQSILWDEEDNIFFKLAEKKAKKSEKNEEDNKEFSTSKMMSMFM